MARPARNAHSAFGIALCASCGPLRKLSSSNQTALPFHPRPSPFSDQRSPYCAESLSPSIDLRLTVAGSLTFVYDLVRQRPHLDHVVAATTCSRTFYLWRRSARRLCNNGGRLDLHERKRQVKFRSESKDLSLKRSTVLIGQSNDLSSPSSFPVSFFTLLSAWYDTRSKAR